MNIHIEDYSPKDNSSKRIKVQTITDERNTDYSFDRSEFMEWAEEKDRLDYQRGEETLQYKPNEYWQTGWEKIHADLKDFIQENFD